MKIYRVQIKKNSTDFVYKNVAAKDIEKAIKDAQRYVKKTYYSTAEIQLVEVVASADIYYKS